MMIPQIQELAWEVKIYIYINEVAFPSSLKQPFLIPMKGKDTMRKWAVKTDGRLPCAEPIVLLTKFLSGVMLMVGLQQTIILIID